MLLLLHQRNFGLLWLAVAHPIVFFVLVAACLVAAVFLARLLWRGIRRLTA